MISSSVFTQKEILYKEEDKRIPTKSALIFNYIDSCVDVCDIDDYSSKLYYLKIRDIVEMLAMARTKSFKLFDELLDLEVRNISDLCDYERDLFMKDMIEDSVERHLEAEEEFSYYD